MKITSIMYPFTKFVPSETNPNKDHPKDITRKICLFNGCNDNETKYFRKYIVVTYYSTTETKSYITINSKKFLQFPEDYLLMCGR
jgi:hypothetical protein